MSAAMEQICTPTRRYQDTIYPDWDDDDNGDFDYAEVQLDMSVEDFLVYRWDWKDLHAFLTGDVKPKLLWITENAFLAVNEDGETDASNYADYIAATIQESSDLSYPALILVVIHPSDDVTAELGVFWRAVATSKSVQLTIKGGG